MENQGQIFTPKFLSEFMCNIAYLQNKEYSNILETSFGEGIFIDSILDKFSKINLTGIEKDTELFLREKNSNRNIDIYNRDFLEFSKNTNKSFDLIIGNPPYIENNKIDISTKENIKKLNLGYDNKEWDLYYYFIQQSIKLLKEDGILVFINPITFLTNTYSDSLRKYIEKEGSIIEIYSLEEEKVFKGADIETIVWVFKKGKKKTKNIKVGFINKKIHYKYTNVLSQDDFIYKNIPQFKIENKFWNIYTDNIKENIYNKKYLKPITEFFNISVGMVSGYDKAFLYNQSIEDLNKVEKEHIINIVKAKDLNKIEIYGDKYIFIQKGLYSNEYDLKKICPNIYKYLQENKEKLLERYNKNNSKYWEWITVRNKGIFEQNKEKFFIESITRKEEITFSYIQETSNEQKLYSGGNVITLTFKEKISKEDRKKLKKILISKEYGDYIINGVPRKGGRKMLTQKYISSLKI